MRADVRIGLAVGGIVLAVLVAYVLFVPASDPDKGMSPPPRTPGQTVGAARPPVAPATQPLPATGPTTTTTAPLAATQPILPPRPASGTMPPGGQAGGVTSPLQGSGITDRSQLWDRALESGKAPILAQRRPSLQGGTGPAVASRRPVSEQQVLGADPPDPLVPASRTHTVQRGETLSSIARSVYGSANLYPAILRANPTINPNRLRPGMVIRLPDVAEGKAQPPSRLQPPSPASVPAPARATTAPTAGRLSSLSSTVAVSPASGTSYRVQAGDNLHRIARKLYGDSSQWRRIYDLNRQLIGPNPARMRADMVLSLPQAHTLSVVR